MTEEQIQNIIDDFGADLIEEISRPSDKRRLYTFQLEDKRIVFIEETKVQHRRKKEANYHICTNSYDSWDGEDDFRAVYKRFHNYVIK